MLSLMSYSLPTGARSLVLVEIADAEHRFTVLDVPLDDSLQRDDDCRVVSHELDDYFQAREVAFDYWRRSDALGRPAVPA
jgi:hypothetical protein